MGEMRCEECGRRYQSKSGLRRHMKAEHGKASFDTPATRATQDVSPSTELRAGFDTAATQPTLGQGEDAAKDVRPEAATGPVERALVDLGIEWKDVMAYRVHSDRIVIIEGPVGFKRTWWFPEVRAEAGSAGNGGFRGN